MTEKDLIKLISSAEQTTVQFKERISRESKTDISSEMAAMSNSQGGIIVIGVNDKQGEINPLSYQETQDTTNLLSDLATNGVVPSILINVENIAVEGGTVVVANIKRGLNKPYRDSKGVIWVKQGADKRKVFDNAELIAMLMDNGQMFPDSMPVKGTSVNDLDNDTVKKYLLNRFASYFERQGLSTAELSRQPIESVVAAIGKDLTLESLFTNAGLILPDGTLTIAALILMGKYPQRWLPAFTVRCVSFVGNSIGGEEFRDKSNGDADGNALHLYEYSMSFLTRNLRSVQVENDFNSLGELEISTVTLSELIVNAILHRSYVTEVPLRIFVFDNRVEIHSPGLLPKGVDTDNIKKGISIPRNKLLFSHGIFLLPYTGAGSGIVRALTKTPDIEFINDTEKNEFVAVIQRKENSAIIDKKPNAAAQTGNETGEVTISPKKKPESPSSITASILDFCQQPKSAKEILSHIGYAYHSRNIAKFIRPLINDGLLAPTITESPNDRRQKYVKR